MTARHPGPGLGRSQKHGVIDGSGGGMKSVPGPGPPASSYLLLPTYPVGMTKSKLPFSEMCFEVSRNHPMSLNTSPTDRPLHRNFNH